MTREDVRSDIPAKPSRVSARAVLLGIVEISLIGLVGAGWSPVVIFVIMLVFLLLRPRGISGVIVQEKA